MSHIPSHFIFDSKISDCSEKTLQSDMMVRQKAIISRKASSQAAKFFDLNDVTLDLDYLSTAETNNSQTIHCGRERSDIWWRVSEPQTQSSKIVMPGILDRYQQVRPYQYNPGFQ